MGWLGAFKKIKILGYFRKKDRGGKGGRKPEKAVEKRPSKKTEEPPEAPWPADPLKENYGANGAANGAAALGGSTLGVPMEAFEEWQTAADQAEWPSIFVLTPS